MRIRAKGDSDQDISAVSEVRRTPSLRRVALVVDDDPDDRQRAAEILEAEGYVVIEASDGEAALDLLRRTTRLPDVVLLDWQMPRMDGEAFLRAMHEHDMLRALRVVVTSGNPRAALPYGVPFVPKPIAGPLLVHLLLGRLKTRRVT